MGARSKRPALIRMNTCRSAHRRLVWLVVPFVALLLLAGCRGTAGAPTIAPTPSSVAASAPSPTPTSFARATAPDAARVPPTAAPRPAAATPEATTTPEPSATPSPTVVPAPAVAEPARLSIPAIGVDANIQQVGLTAQGNMDVPSNYTDVAWYKDGARPSAPGNAVIDGHLDSKTGPAVFWTLGELKPGDDVFVTTADGARLRFVVTGSETYPADQAPTYRIFGPAAAPQLNLITCDGTFNRDVRQYDRRLVVYTVLAPPA